MSRLAAKSPSGRAGWLLAIPLVLAAAAYARVLNAEFQFDDASTVQHNRAVRDVGAYLGGFLERLFHSGRPVTELTFSMNYAVGRLEPWNYHVTNLTIHLVVVALIFVFTHALLRLAGTPQPAAIAVSVAGLFALHPLQSQAVSYVSQRSEALASGFYVATLLLLLTAERRGRSAAGIAAYAAAVATLVLGLGAKVIVVTLLFAYLLLAWVVPGEAGRKRLATWPTRFGMVVPLLGLDAFFALTTLRGIEGRPDAGFSVPGAPPGSYFLTQWRAVATYLRLLFWPAGQNVDWGYPISRSLADPAVLGAGLFLLALAAGAAALSWRSRYGPGAAGAAGRIAGFGVLWFLLVLAPTSSVVPIVDALVEHRVYLASWGVLVAVAVAVERALSRLPGGRRALAATALVGLAWSTLAVCLHERNAVWESRLALWGDSAVKSPRHWRSHLNLGHAHWDRGHQDEGIEEVSRAVDIVAAEAPTREAELLADLGAMLIHAGRLDEARAALGRASERDPKNARVLANLAVATLKQQDLQGAELHATRALALDPTLGRALEVIGEVRLDRGDAAGALPYLARAVKAKPDDAAALFYLGVAYERLGRSAQACAVWRQVLAVPGIAQGVRALTTRQSAAAGCAGL